MKHVLASFGVLCILIGLAPLPTQAADETVIGCCQMVKKNGASEVKDMTKEDCEKPDEENYQSKQWFGDKRRLGSKCETKVAVQARKEGDPIYFQPAVTIPGTDYVAGSKIQVADSTLLLANYIVAVFKYSIGVIGLIAVIVMMVGGIIWLTAAGNGEQVAGARKMITSALLGAILAACSFILLSIINTNLVDLKITNVKKIQPISFDPGCCMQTKAGVVTTANMLAAECAKSNPAMKDFDTLAFFAEQEAENGKCVEPKGCCQVKLRGVGTPLRAFNVDSKSLCKIGTLQIDLPGGGIASEALASWTFMKGYTEGEPDATTGNATECVAIAGQSQQQQQQNCIGENQTGCQTTANCCSGFKCSLGGTPPGTKCERCIPLWYYQCSVDADCCDNNICQDFGVEGKKCVPRP